MMLVHMIEMLSWGDAGIYLCIPGQRAGRRGHQAVGTPEQLERFLTPLHRRRPQVGRHGHDRAAGRLRHEQHPDHGDL